MKRRTSLSALRLVRRSERATARTTAEGRVQEHAVQAQVDHARLAAEGEEDGAVLGEGEAQRPRRLAQQRRLQARSRPRAALPRKAATTDELGSRPTTPWEILEKGWTRGRREVKARRRDARAVDARA